MSLDSARSEQRSASSVVDDLCDRFEAELRQGGRPKLENYLAGLKPEVKNRLFEELLILKLSYRQQDEEVPQLEEYLQRFPDHDSQVRRAFNHPSISVGEYRFVDRLGSGGMGEVFLAIHARLRKRVAVKRLPERLMQDPRAQARFQREMQIVGQLEHPNIVRASDAGEVDGRHFLVMEFIRGRDFDHLLKMQGRMAVGVACEAVRQAALGLGCAHEHGIVHRDVKPSNLMLDGQGVVKVLDLGLATLSEDGGKALTESGTLLGTVDYMAPEQWRDPASVDQRADVYSLGCTLFHLLAGRAPYNDSVFCNTRDKKMMAHVSAPAPSVLELRPDCPPALNDVVRRMMAKEPADRYAGTLDAAEALVGFCDRPALIELARPLGGGSSIHKGAGSSLGSRRSRSGASPAAEPQLHDTLPIDAQGAPTSRVGAGAAPREPDPSGVSGSSSVSKILKIPRRTWLKLGLVGAAVGGGGLWMTLSRGPSAEALAARRRLGPMSGLHGGWWFEEAPWFSPGVRSAWFKALERGETTVSGAAMPDTSAERLFRPNVVEVYNELKPFALALTHRLPPSESALAAHLNSISTTMELKDYKAKLGEIHRDSAPEGPGATELHLRAAVCHFAADMEAALLYYQAALARYAVEAGPPELVALCHGDYARLLLGKRQSDQAKIAWDKALNTAESFDPSGQDACTLIVAGRCQQARADQTQAPTDAEDRCLDADNAAKTLPDEHPLHSHVAETLGWIRLEQWRLEESITAFETAVRLRRTKGELNSSVGIRARLFAQQGPWMAVHFQGQQSQAVAGYSALIDEINRMLRENKLGEHPLTPRDKGEIRGRLPNLHERLADCHLYGDSPKYSEAAEHLESAVREAELANFEFDPRAAELARLRFLKALAYALDGKHSEASLWLADARRRAEAKDFSPEDSKVYTLTELTASSALALAGGSEVPAAQRDKAVVALLEILDRERVSRKELELVLLISERLFASNLLDQPDLINASRGLVRLTFDIRSQNSTRPYLLRYFSAAQSALRRSLAATPNGALEAELTFLEQLVPP